MTARQTMTEPNEELADRLCELLGAVRDRAQPRFSGIGLIVTNRPDTLPILPLRPTSTLAVEGEIAALLARISDVENEYHDGFHVVSTDWRLIRVAQYFSPPIAQTPIDRTRRFGGRYLAALFGSALPHIELTGIASEGFGVAVFRGGAECRFRP